MTALTALERPVSARSRSIRAPRRDCRRRLWTTDTKLSPMSCLARAVGRLLDLALGESTDCHPFEDLLTTPVDERIR